MMSNAINVKKEDLPLALETKHVQQILGVGQRQAYELMKNPPFHTVVVGKIIKAPRDMFFKWFEGEQG